MSEENKFRDGPYLKVPVTVLREVAEILKEDANNLVIFYETPPKMEGFDVLPARVVRGYRANSGCGTSLRFHRQLDCL